MMLVFTLSQGASANTFPIEVYDRDVDYSILMIDAAVSGDYQAGLLAEQVRLEKIMCMGLDEAIFSFEEFMLLAKIIHAEAGSSWLSSEWKMSVGEVVLNRVASPEFPDTIRDVIMQPGQYAGANSRWFKNLVPDQCSAEAALRVMQGERLMTPTVVFQANFRQGSGTHKVYHDRHLGTTYFCYSSNPSMYY